MNLRLLLTSALLGILAVLAPLGSLSLAAGGGTIDGSLVDSTSGVPLPAGLVVALQSGRPNQSALATRTATVDATGHFQFANVASDGTSYVVTTRYGGVIYSSPVNAPADGSSGASVTLTIYEPTTADTAIHIDSANWVFEGIDVDNQQLQILETIDVLNTGDRTYVGDHRGDPGSDTPGVLPRTIRLLLPNGASDMTPAVGLDPGTLLPMANGYVDTAPVLPGLHELAFTYMVAYADGGAEIQKALPYPTTKLRFLAPDVGLELQSDRLKADGKVDVAGHSYVVYSGDQIPPDSNVTIDVLGLPSTTAGRIDAGWLQLAGYVAIGLAILAALVFGLWALRQPSRFSVADRTALVTALARLDDAYAAGQVEREQYRRERAELKQRLVELSLGGPSLPDVAGASR
jgi:hypothetical protein